MLELEPLPPFRLDLTAWTLRRRPENLVDSWEDGTYRRTLYLGRKLVDVSVKQVGPPDRPLLEAAISGAGRSRASREAIVSVITRMLGLTIDLEPFYQAAGTDATLGPLAARFRGMKPPRLPSLFETLVNAIACQQLTLTVGIILLNRLTVRCSPPIDASNAMSRPFPRAADVVQLTPEQLRALGFSRQKGLAIHDLAAAVEDGRTNFDMLDRLDDDAAIETLRQLTGIGRWSAEYALLRGLGRLSVFPYDDVGARKNLGRWLKVRRSLDYERARRRLLRWQPYAGLIYFHLLLKQLAESGYLQ